MSDSDILLLIYQKLEIEVIRTMGATRHETIFSSLLRAKSNKVFDIFMKSAVEDSNIPPDALHWMLENNFVRLVLDNNSRTRSYILTTKGIWYEEEKLGKINTGLLLNILQSTNFDFSISTDPLSDKEKVVLISLLSFRAFSRKAAMNLSPQKCDHWLQVLHEIDKLGTDLGLYKKSIFDKTKFGLENPVSYFMRRMNNLSKKTNNIYCSPGEKLYFLNIDQDDKGSCDKIEFLWTKIFPETYSFHKKKDLLEKSDSITQKNLVYICDDFEMFDSKWNTIIEQSKFRLLS